MSKEKEKDVVSVGMKKCRTCGKEKESTLENFHAGRGSKGGFLLDCKECKRAKERGDKYYLEHFEREEDTTPAGYKKCSDCGKNKEQTAEFFHRDKGFKSGFKARCKDCENIIRNKPKRKANDKKQAQNRNARPEVRIQRKEQRKEYKARPEVTKHTKEYNKEYLSRPEVKKHTKEYHKEWYKKPENKERKKQQDRINSQKPENKAKRAERRRERYKNEPLFRIRVNLSRNFSSQLKTLGTKKPSGTMTYTGCTNEELLKHLNTGEYTMKDYMTNTPLETFFDFDHIIPSQYFLDRIKTDENDKITKETLPWLHNWWSYRNMRIWPHIPNIIKGKNIDQELIAKHGIEDLLTID
jgi:hypothetical protein